MSDTVQAGNLLLGRGEVYFDRFDANGLATGERFLGNCTTFEVSNNDDVREKYSSAEASSPLVKRINTRRTMELSIALNEFNKENVALAFMGAEATLSQSSGSFTSGSPDNITARLDRWVPLQKRSVSSVVVKNSAQTVTYVLNTDYKVDAVAGRLYFVAGGAITDAQALKVEYSYAVVSLPKVQAGVSSFIEGKVRFVGKPATGPTWEVEVWKVSVSPEGALSLIGDDFAEFTLKAAVLADTSGHPTEPYFAAYKLA